MTQTRRLAEDSIPYFSDKWADIADLTRRWARRFPEEYRENLAWVTEARQDYKMNKYEDRPLRKGILIHPRLMIYIQNFHPTFMDTNEDVREFATRFPKFVVDDGVKKARSK